MRRRGQVDDDSLDRARQAGLDEGLIVEVLANVALNVLSNYLNNTAATAIDFPVADLDSAA